MSASLATLAQHEARLGWRDLLWMFGAGKKRRLVRAGIGLLLFLFFLHWLSYVVLTHGVSLHAANDVQTLVIVSASVLLSWMLMLSQAMEAITRGFYTRGDLDLILASPVKPQRVFALRVAVQAVVVSFMSIVLVGPVMNVLAFTDTPRWLAGYGVALAMGLTATAIAVALTVALFHVAGPKRTRFIAQIVAAVVGAAFVIGVQMAAIMQSGNLSRFSFLRSPAVLAHAPDAESVWWLPARAIMGDMHALMGVFGAAIALYIVVTWPLVGRFAHYSTVAAGVALAKTTHRKREHFETMSKIQAMRRKEWTLIKRDPWLVSQTLMQLLYLAPPALLLWKDFATGGQGILVLVPVLVMAAGQLAGGVTWITISGEDAPDLVATAPLSARQVMRAKLQTVMRTVAVVFVPLVAILALESPWAAAVSVGGIIASSAAAARIQLWFRTQARRNSFRRRHTASRIATFAEAFCCISLAGAAALVAAKTWLALAALVFALLVLAVARSLRPNK